MTVINKKDPGVEPQDANVTIVAKGAVGPATAVFLAAPNQGVAAKEGIRLGGAPVQEGGGWDGKWTPLAPGKAGDITVKVPGGSAAVVKMEGLGKL